LRFSGALITPVDRLHTGVPTWIGTFFPTLETVIGAHDIVSSVKDIDGEARGTGPAAPASSGPAGTALAERPEAGSAAARSAALLAAQLLTAVGAVRRTTRRAALPPARSELLRLAARQPGITVAEAARELRLAPNTVSTMVGRLTDQGLLTRGRSSRDGRTVRLNVTAAARQRLARWKDLRAELAGQALAQLPARDRDAIAAAVPALTRLAEQMENR
jgi:DNA-binding MarR family transcriptional regulator